MLTFIKNYFAQKFTPTIRYLHYVIAALIIAQIVNSEFIEINKQGIISQQFFEFYATWGHFFIGLFLLTLSLLFIILQLNKHSFSYFYPYLFGDISQLKSDVNSLKQLQIPETQAKGLAAIIKGLGLGALFLTAASGAAWFYLWFFNLPYAHDIKELHELFTGLIEAYIVGHGALGLIHIYFEYEKTR